MYMEYAGYLFVHFTGENLENGEQIYFSVSRDGLHWQDLNDAKPVLTAKGGTNGARDPFVIRVKKNGKDKYYIIATDLNIHNSKNWHQAQYDGSRSLFVWESDNLIDWAGPYLREVAISGAGCLWAPEAIYDEERDEIMVFFASMTKFEGDESHKQRIFYTYTKDFETFSEPRVFIEKDNHVIDTTMIKAGDKFYRYSKDETHKNINVDVADCLKPEAFKELYSDTLCDLYGVEGPEIFKFNDREEWCLIVDRFATHAGYLPMVTSDLASGNFRVLDDSEYDFGTTLKRHGGIMNITEIEYRALTEKFL